MNYSMNLSISQAIDFHKVIYDIEDDWRLNYNTGIECIMFGDISVTYEIDENRVNIISVRFCDSPSEKGKQLLQDYFDDL